MKSYPFITEENEPVIPPDAGTDDLVRAVTRLMERPCPTGIAEEMLRLSDGDIRKHLTNLVRTALLVRDLLAQRQCRQASRFEQCANVLNRLTNVLELRPPGVDSDRWAIAVAVLAHVVMTSYAPLEDWSVAVLLALTRVAGYEAAHARFTRLLGASSKSTQIATADAVGHLVQPDDETRSIERRFAEARKPLADRRLAEQLQRLFQWERKLERTATKHPLQADKEDREGDILLPEDTPSPLEIAPSTEPDPAEVVADKDLLERIFTNLKEDERVLLQMYAEGHTDEEVATLLGATPESVKKRRQRLTNRLRHTFAS